MTHLAGARQTAISMKAPLGFGSACSRTAESGSIWSTALAAQELCAAAGPMAGPDDTAGLPSSTVDALSAMAPRNCGAETRAAVLAGLMAHAIEAAVHYARVRQVAGRRMSEHQLTAPRLSLLAIAEQAVTLHLDVLSDDQSASPARLVALAEIHRHAIGVAEMLVDHFGGAAYVADGQVPLCSLLERFAQTLNPLRTSAEFAA